MKKLNKKGFTLIEMLVVIAIIAILVAIIVPTVSNATAKSKAATDAANLRSIAAEITIDMLDNSVVDETYTAECKSVDGADTIEAYEINNEIKAYFTDGENYYGVDEFAAVAATGDPLGTATIPTGNKIYPSSTETD